MGGMVEQVARALCWDCGVPPDDTAGGVWDGGSYPLGRPAWQCWEDQARLAIEAMRWPTKEMVDAGIAERRGTFEIWQTMIDKALS